MSNNADQSIIVLRAISGAGKTTFAHKLVQSRRHELVSGQWIHGGYVIVGADDLFTDEETGEYRFDPAKIGAAHGYCFQRAIEAVRRGFTVIVDNTNTTVAEIAPYMLLAQAYGIPARVITLRCDVETAHGRAKHGASREAIKQMHADLEAAVLPSWWAHEALDNRD